MEIGIGDKVRRSDAVGTVGVVYRVCSDGEVKHVGEDGMGWRSTVDELVLLAKAHYQPLIEVGDKVLVLEDGKEGIVFKIDRGSTLPYVVGHVDRGTSWGYSSKELKLIAKARYEEQ